jgi:single-stranded-DNA-specific exonuclease
MSRLWKLKSKTPDDIREEIISGLSSNPLPLHQSSPNQSSNSGLEQADSGVGQAIPPPEGEGNGVLLAQLLFNRGLKEKDEIRDFLEPKYENLHSPFLFKDMEKAVERIWEAIDRNEKICVYGDYDADAITANAVLAQTFKHLGVEVSSYIPDRFTEGYGVNLDALSKIKDSSFAKASEDKKGSIGLIITVDCGTNSVDAAEFCKENNIDLIITDHHEIIGEVPKAYALINPKNPNDGYPYREITGVGVAFKLACGILSKIDKTSSGLEPSPLTPLPSNFAEASSDLRKGEGKPRIAGWEKWLLDLVAIGTVADCHSLLGENRILVKYGLKVLAKTKWIGLRALMQSAGLADSPEGSPLGIPQRGTLWKPLDTYTLGFVIAPRLNAAGRLEHAGIALDLLLETDINLAKEKAQNLENINTRRQGLTASVLSEAKEKVLLLKERKVLALVGEGWPKGVMGLVAGRLAEEFYKPTIVLERTENLCTGSARTAGDFDMLEALKFSSEHLSKFGGHKQAAGLSLQADKFDLFYQKLLVYAEANILLESAQKILELEAELTPSQLSLSVVEGLQSLQPFGVSNPFPKFLISNLQVSSTRLVGKQAQHLQMKLNIGNREIGSIMFNAPDFAKTLKIGDTVDVAAELIEDGWNGKKDVKLKIIDIKDK